MNNNKKLALRYASFALAAVIMVFIFAMSAQNSEDSANTSEGFIRTIAPFLNPKFASLSSEEQEAFVGGLQFFVRKGAHFSIYTLLGISLALGFTTINFNKAVLRLVLPWGIGAVYAATDEWHQYFVPGRSCEFRDLLIDSCGALLGCLIIYICYNISIKKRAV